MMVASATHHYLVGSTEMPIAGALDMVMPLLPELYIKSSLDPYEAEPKRSMASATLSLSLLALSKSMNYTLKINLKRAY